MPTQVMAATVSVADSVPVTGAPPAPNAPYVSFVVSGAQSARLERFKITAINASGESAGSAETIVEVPANSVVAIAPLGGTYGGGIFGGGSAPYKATTWNVYATVGASGTETLQNAVPLSTSVGWQEPSTGLTSSGAAVPTTPAPNPGFTSVVSTLTDSPTATGVLAPPQSPLNTPTPSTGRTTEATQTQMATLLNILNVGTTPPPTGNLRN